MNGERDMIAEHSKRLTEEVNKSGKENDLTYEQKLSALDYYIHFCNAKCFIDKIYWISALHILQEEAKNEELNHRMSMRFVMDMINRVNLKNEIRRCFLIS